MIELLKHIETLLLENDCVIIPSFGGFVSHYTPARWIEDEGIFLPPTRSIGFNPQLKMNDGLLVQSYMTSYCTDFSDASKLINKAVDELINTLHVDGKVEMHGIGDMFFTIHGKLQFQPYEDGLLTPYLYGLSSFGINKIDEVVKTIDEKVVPETSNQKVYEIRVNRSFIRTAVAVAAAIIIFFLMSTPVENTYVEKGNYAQLIPSELLEPFDNSLKESVPAKKQVNNQKVQEEIKPKAIKEVVIPKNNIENKSNTAKPLSESANKNSCHIIIASVNKRADAQEIVDRLISKGYSKASIIEGKKWIRVSIMSLSNNDEANNKLLQLKKNKNFKDAWLLTDK
nr:SPOR domain-containing protein [uncultured Bacteroides sp.]